MKELGDNQRETGLKVPGLSVPGVYLSGCDSGGLIHMVENRSFYAECFGDWGLRYSGETYMHWQIQPWRQNETLDLVCNESGSCTTHPEVRAERFLIPYYSSLEISNVERAMFNSSTITCSMTPANGSDTSVNTSCLVDLFCKYLVFLQCVTNILIISQ